MAAWVLWTRPDRQQNRIVALMGLAGVLVILWAMFARLGDGAVEAGATSAGLVAGVLFGTCILWLMGTLPGPWVLMLRSRLARAVMATAAAAVLVLLVAGVPGPAASFPGLAALFGIVVTGADLTRRRSTITRRQIAWTLVGLAAFASSWSFFDSAAWVLPVGHALAAGAITFGVLQSQVLDMAMRIRLFVRETAIATVFATAFLVVSETAEFLLPVDGQDYAIAAAALIALALQPLQRFANRIAVKAVPGTLDAPAYLQAQRAAIFRAAAEGAYRDDEITPRERRFLDSLRDDLGLSTKEARALEAESKAVS